jgi:hypothetical protein
MSENRVLCELPPLATPHRPYLQDARVPCVPNLVGGPMSEPVYEYRVVCADGEWSRGDWHANDLADAEKRVRLRDGGHCWDNCPGDDRRGGRNVHAELEATTWR